MERYINGTRFAFLHSPSNVKGLLFEQSNEAALEAEKAGGADHRSLHELVEFSGGAKFEGDFKNFVQFVGLGASHPVKLGIGNCHSAETSQGRDQALVFLRKRARQTRINKNGTVRS